MADDGDHIENDRTEKGSDDVDGLSRGEMLAGGAAALIGLGLGGLALSSTAGAQTLELPHSTLSLLPSDIAAAYFRSNLLKDKVFNRFYGMFAKRGFQFVPERVQLAIGIRRPGTGEQIGLPYLIAIVPGFTTVALQAKGHRAASIVAVRQAQGMAVSAAEVFVRHNPFQIASFTGYDLDATGRILATKPTSREALQASDPSVVAKQLGVFKLASGATVDGPIGEDVGVLATTAFANLLNDGLEKVHYPPEAMKQLSADAPLVQKWGAVTQLRYQNAGAAARLKIKNFCCSTSCSCAACSSSSTSKIGKAS